MTIRVHHAAQLPWRQIGDIPMGAMRDHVDPSELEGHLAFHEPGDMDMPQLMEIRLKPNTVIAPHSHDECEIVYVIEGSLHWGASVLEAGGSMFIAGNSVYSFRTGPEGARLLNFRPRADHSFHPPAPGVG
ncbi:MAG TPA: hypothetical protein VL918_10475 [Sphingobium sp.]|nr:hypothetical protein [Sphingobium sp.]